MNYLSQPQQAGRKEQQLDFPRTIYAIQHNVTKRMYIGSTADLDQRLRSHLSALRGGKHRCKLMQDDFNKYGDSYSLYSLEVITDYDDRFNEYEWQDKYNTKDPAHGYNSRDKGGTKKRLNIIHELPEIKK